MQGNLYGAAVGFPRWKSPYRPLYHAFPRTLDVEGHRGNRPPMFFKKKNNNNNKKTKKQKTLHLRVMGIKANRSPNSDIPKGLQIYITNKVNDEPNLKMCLYIYCYLEVGATFLVGIYNYNYYCSYEV